MLMPQNVHELKIRILDSRESLGMHLLPFVRNKIGYCFDVCRITSGTHIEIK